MVTTFNRKDLVEFGNYLLSEEREIRYKNHPMGDKMGSLRERLSQVNHADFENWMHDKAMKNLHKSIFGNQDKIILSRIDNMCQESLSPEVYDMWESVKSHLIDRRRDLKS